MGETRTLPALCAELRSRSVRFHTDPERDNRIIKSLATLVQCLLAELDHSPLPEGEEVIPMGAQIDYYTRQLANNMEYTITWTQLERLEREMRMPYRGKVAEWVKNEEVTVGNEAETSPDQA